MDKATRFFTLADVDRKWHVVNAEGQTLGRLASAVAHLLRGKHNPMFTPNADLGDFVVVVNASKIRVTGKRADLKEYFHYTGYPGGATFEKFHDVLQKHPERVIEHAVKGMLPHNRLGKKIFSKLKIYAGPEHPHSAQQPEVHTIPTTSL